MDCFVAALLAMTLEGSPSCIAKYAGMMARDLLKCYAGGAEAAQFTHN